MYSKSCTKEKPCIVKTPDVVKTKRDMDVKIGQGEGETRWKGWAWKLLLTKLVILLSHNTARIHNTE